MSNREHDLPAVLLVDDLRDNLMVLESLLDDMFEIDIVTATSGSEALNLMSERDFALVLLDVQMPDMDGFEVAERMRANEATNHIPIIFVTGVGKETKHIFKGYEAGAVDYLFKPVEPHILRSKVQVFADLCEQRRQIERHLEEIKTLKGMLPICSYCKKIRDDAGYWDELEVYVRHHSDAEFSHSVCPDCMAEHYPGLADRIAERMQARERERNSQS